MFLQIPVANVSVFFFPVILDLPWSLLADSLERSDGHSPERTLKAKLEGNTTVLIEMDILPTLVSLQKCSVA